MGGSCSYLTGSDPKTEKKHILNPKKLKILSTETSPMSYVTATVIGGSESYLAGSDPKIYLKKSHKNQCNKKYLKSQL